MGKGADVGAQLSVPSVRGDKVPYLHDIYASLTSPWFTLVTIIFIQKVEPILSHFLPPRTPH